MFIRRYVFCFLLLNIFNVNSQTLIMNEVSQGVMGNMEWVEFVVVDTAVVYNCSNPVPPCIDIRGWIFDDNSGYHGAAGVAAGAIRFSNNILWSCLPLGTIIVIYNNTQPEPSLPPIDNTLSDGNCRIIVPVNDPLLFESNTTTPGAVACSYPATGWTAGGNWNNTLLANSGDCARIVNTLGCEVFSVCYGSANLNTQIYFANGADGTGTHTNTVYYFNGVDPNSQANWSIGCTDNEIVLDANQCGANVQTPGFPNNPANQAYIDQFNNGCQPITPTNATLSASANETCNCDGSASLTASGSIPGYSYQWLNSSFQPIGQVTATASNLCDGSYYGVVTSSIGCSDTVLVTITPGATINMNAVTNQVLCSGTNSTPITFSGAPAGAVYNWTNSNPIIGIPTSGTGNINAFTAITNLTVNDTAFFNVTPVFNGCNGTPINFFIVVKPTPTVNTPGNISVCAGEAINPSDFSSNIIGTAFTWTNTNTDIGLPANGSGQIITYSAPANNTGNAISGMIDVTPQANGCLGSTQSFSISIRPTPLMNAQQNLSICEGASVNVDDFTAVPNGSSFSWTNNNTSIGLSANGNGQLPIFSAANNTNISQTSTITVLPNVDGCPGNPITFNITVHPLPEFTLTLTNPSSCASADGSIMINGLTNGTIYQLQYHANGTVVNTTATAGIGGSVNIPDLPAGSYSNFFVSLNGCVTTVNSVIELIDPNAPQLVELNDTTICDTFILPTIQGTNLSGSQAYYSLPNGNGLPIVSGGVLTQSQTIYVYDQTGLCTDSYSFQLIVNPTPILNEIPDTAVCDSLLLSSPTVSTGTADYFSASLGNGSFYPTGSYLSQSQTVYVYATNGSCFSEDTFQLTVWENPSLIAFLGGSNYCEGENPQPITGTFSGSGPFELFYSFNGISNSLTISGNTFSISAAEGTYQLTGISDTHSCITDLSNVATIAFIPLPESPLLPNDSVYCESLVPDSLVAEGAGSLSWFYNPSDLPFFTGNALPSPTTAGIYTYYVTSTVNGCESVPATFTIEIQDCDILIPTAFTPDQDGANDSWQLIDLDNLYPESQVFIYNRWGSLLYESIPGSYNSKPWNGTFIGNRLPVASYYYVIDFNTGKESAKGIVTIVD
jgi:gliding motility-associated-like protein